MRALTHFNEGSGGEGVSVIFCVQIGELEGDIKHRGCCLVLPVTEGQHPGLQLGGY